MKLFIKNNVVVWSLPDNHPNDNTEDFEIVHVPNGTILEKSGENGMLIPMTASEVIESLNHLPYTEKRAFAYPSIQEQLDMQYWDAINGTTTWQDAINAVKTAHPKGQ